MSLDSDYYSLKTRELLYETLEEFKDMIFQRMAEKAEFNIELGRLEAFWDKMCSALWKANYESNKKEVINKHEKPAL